MSDRPDDDDRTPRITRATQAATLVSVAIGAVAGYAVGQPVGFGLGGALLGALAISALAVGEYTMEAQKNAR